MKKINLLTLILTFSLTSAQQTCGSFGCYMQGKVFFWTIAIILLVILIVLLIIWLTKKQVSKEDKNFVPFEEKEDSDEVKFQIESTHDKDKENL